MGYNCWITRGREFRPTDLLVKWSFIYACRRGKSFVESLLEMGHARNPLLSKATVKLNRVLLSCSRASSFASFPRMIFLDWIRRSLSLLLSKLSRSQFERKRVWKSCIRRGEFCPRFSSTSRSLIYWMNFSSTSQSLIQLIKRTTEPWERRNVFRQKSDLTARRNSSRYHHRLTLIIEAISRVRMLRCQ